MAAGVRTIAVRWLGDTKDLEKAGGRGEKAIGKWQGAFKKLDKVATGVLIGLGGAIAGAVGATVKAGDEIAKASRTAGVAAEPFQELRFAFGQAGIDASEFDSSMRRLNRRLGLAAEGGGPAIKAFESLDIAVHDANGQVRDTTDVLEEALPKLAAIESDAERAATASQLFGEDAGPGLAAALSEGTAGIDEARQKAQDLGIVMDQDALDASEEFSDAMDDLKKVGVGLIRDFALPFLEIFREQILPVLQDRVIPAIRSFGDFISDNKGLVLTIVGVLASLAVIIKTVTAVIRVVTVVTAIYNAVLAANPVVLITLAIIALIAIVVALIIHWDTVTAALAAAWEFIKDAAVSVWTAIKDFFVDLWNSITEFIGDAIDKVKEIFFKFHPLGIIIDNWEPIKGFIVDTWNDILSFITELPGKIADKASGMFNGIRDAFKSAINFVIDAWNGLSFTLPSAEVFGQKVGGFTLSPPRLPRLHTGGTVPGRVGEEVLILAEAGEEVTPRNEVGGAMPDEFVATATLNLGEGIERVVDVKFRRKDRTLKRRTLAGAGAFG